MVLNSAVTASCNDVVRKPASHTKLTTLTADITPQRGFTGWFSGTLILFHTGKSRDSKTN